MKKISIILLLLIIVACSKNENYTLENFSQNKLTLSNSILSENQHTLVLQGADFTINNELLPLNSLQEYSLLLPEGQYDIKADYYLQLGMSTRKFYSWQDGSRENPRKIMLERDTYLKAIYKDYINIVLVTRGSLTNGTFLIEEKTYEPGEVEVEVGKKYLVTAKAPAAHVFVRWSDGVEDATREIIAEKRNSSYDIYYAEFEWFHQWKSNILYKKGDLAINNNKFFMAKWDTIGEEPDEKNPYGSWQEQNPHNLPNWNLTTEYKKDDIVIYNNKSYIAKWWTRGDEPKDTVNNPWILIK